MRYFLALLSMFSELSPIYPDHRTNRTLFNWIWRRLCLVLLMLTTIYFGTRWWLFIWSADVLIALLPTLLTFIQILCKENSAIIQFKVLKLVAQMYSK